MNELLANALAQWKRDAVKRAEARYIQADHNPASREKQQQVGTYSHQSRPSRAHHPRPHNWRYDPGYVPPDHTKAARADGSYDFKLAVARWAALRAIWHGMEKWQVCSFEDSREATRSFGDVRHQRSAKESVHTYRKAA